MCRITKDTFTHSFVSFFFRAPANTNAKEELREKKWMETCILQLLMVKVIYGTNSFIFFPRLLSARFRTVRLVSKFISCVARALAKFLAVNFCRTFPTERMCRRLSSYFQVAFEWKLCAGLQLIENEKSNIFQRVISLRRQQIIGISFLITFISIFFSFRMNNSAFICQTEKKMFAER